MKIIQHSFIFLFAALYSVEFLHLVNFGVPWGKTTDIDLQALIWTKTFFLYCQFVHKVLSVIWYQSSKWGKSSFCVVLNLVWKKLRWAQTESRTVIHSGSAVRRWFTFCKPVLCYSLFAHIWLIYYFKHQ